MAEQAGVAVVDIVGNTGPLNASLNDAEQRTRASVQNMSRAFNSIAQGTGNAGRSTEQLANRMQRLSQTAREGVSQFTRVRAATQLVSMQFNEAQKAGLSFGQSLAASSSAVQLLGSVIVGNLVGQALTSLARALVQATTQFASMRNEMETVTALSGNVGQEFAFINQAAQQSNRSLGDLSKSFIEASKAAHELGVSQEFVRRTFAEYNAALATRQEQTIGSSASKFMDSLGGAISGFDRLTGISNVIVGAFNLMTSALNKITSLLPRSVTSLDDWKVKQEAINQHLAYHNRLANDASVSVKDRATHERTIVGLKEEQVKAAEKIKELEAKLVPPEVAVRRKGAMDDLLGQLNLEAMLMGKSNATIEVRNRLNQIDLQFRSIGKNLSQEETMQIYEKLKANALLKQDMEGSQFAYQTWLDRLMGERTILDELNFSWMTHAEMVEQATARINAAYGQNAESARMVADIKRQLALQEQRGMLDTASAAANAIQSLWPRQKGAAIAAAVINTAVGVTKALTAGVPPWNFAQAALVAAAGAGQIASIRSTNLSGGSVANVSGGGGIAQPTAPEAQAAAPMQRAVNIYMPKGEFFSSEQMEKFIARINEEVANGATLISTKTAPT